MIDHLQRGTYPFSQALGMIISLCTQRAKSVRAGLRNEQEATERIRSRDLISLPVNTRAGLKSFTTGINHQCLNILMSEIFLVFGYPILNEQWLA